ncbi:SusD-like starch-binding protein associating with outer membrane [Mucilaginibacter gracilis]|uniref:SusD-like starch-binding protein associating with outer membrane n=1 Tax=Mucilaginibacter gracilis TaxID=423350 RepID=A0A495IY73_9SPHI|nr:RagB/SusD family nutrient uptake outer membrane protein [Mucilaginibacter gracilis]RKR81004.1 SusD-like starch-binding protein associating with outer membrane [Mucilaginibacter gracilis]
MKMNITKLIKRNILLLFFMISVFSCKKIFDYQPENVLDITKNYQDVNDADAVILGLYGKFAKVMDKYIVLNELQGDLMDVTPNADKYLKEINEHSATTDNPWADPKPFYALVIDCNDIMYNFKEMLRTRRMTQAEFDIRYSEVTTVWVWVYLQLGIQYGSVPFVTDPLATIDAVKDPSKSPTVSFDVLIDNLIAMIRTVPVLNPIALTDETHTPIIVTAGSSLIRVIDGYSTSRMFLNRYFLFGDVFLWKGSYAEAAHYYRAAMDLSEYVKISSGSGSYPDFFRVTGSKGEATGPTWDSDFISPFDGDIKSDIISQVPFDKKFQPGNPFISLFSHAGKYLLKPSAKSINNWDIQYRSDNSPIDIYRGPDKSYSMGPEPEVKKLIAGFNKLNPLETTGKFIIQRSRGLHLRFLEAANRDGRDQLAYALLNNGLKAAYTGPPPVPANVVNIMQSFDANPDYYFDARAGQFPPYVGIWSGNIGIRGNASLVPVKVDSVKYFDMSVPALWDKPVKDAKGLAIAQEDLILKENALEMAFEGVRWTDLVRVGLRREKEIPGSGLAFMQATVAAKFIAAGKSVPPGVAQLGSSVANWYLPFKR